MALWRSTVIVSAMTMLSRVLGLVRDIVLLNVFGAGKDFDTFVEEFTNRIGLDKLSLFHLNDSRVPFASKKDRHENLTVGHIFSDNGCRGLKYLLSFVRQYRIPCIGEPPDKDADGKKAPGWKWDLEIITRLVPDLLIAK